MKRDCIPSKHFVRTVLPRRSANIVSGLQDVRQFTSGRSFVPSSHFVKRKHQPILSRMSDIQVSENEVTLFCCSISSKKPTFQIVGSHLPALSLCLTLWSDDTVVPIKTLPPSAGLVASTTSSCTLQNQKGLCNQAELTDDDDMSLIVNSTTGGGSSGHFAPRATAY